MKISARVFLIPFLAIALITGLASSVKAQAAHDVRIVNGLSIDLMPVHIWLSTNADLRNRAIGYAPANRRRRANASAILPSKGWTDPDRPLKHWKVFRIAELLTSTAFMDHCVVFNEDGLQQRVYVKNIDPQIKAPFLPLLEIQPKIDALQKDLDANQDIVTGLIGAPGTPDGPGTSKRTALAARQNAESLKIAKLRIADDQARLNDLQARKNSILLQLQKAQQVEFLAMFNGEKVPDLDGRTVNPVCDSGLQKK